MKLTPSPWRWESIPGARGKKRRVLMGGTPGQPQHKILTQASDCVGTDAMHEGIIAASPEMLAALENQAGTQRKIFTMLNSYAEQKHLKEWVRLSLEGMIAQVYGDLAAHNSELLTVILKAKGVVAP